MQARKPDALRDAEARVRALTYEVGTLREELKRECKRRERAVLRAQEADGAREVAEQQVHELRWAAGWPGQARGTGQLQPGAGLHAGPGPRAAQRAQACMHAPINHPAHRPSPPPAPPAGTATAS
jgi:hypothetical protein